MASSDRLTRLTNIRDNLEKELEDETAYRAANGPKPTYTANGRNVDWNGWLAAMLKAIKDAQDAVDALEVYEFHTRGYT